MTDVRDNAEKDSAFRGLCAAARINAASVANVSASNLVFVSL